MRSDDDLLEAWRDGDRQAGRELFARYYATVDRFFRNKVGDDSAELVQRTFLGCLERLDADRYENRDSFRSWLFAIAYRQLCKHYRNLARDRQKLDLGTVSAHDLDPTPSSMIARSEEERLLLEALRQIPIDHQVVLELHYWESMSDAEIARTLQTPHGTIKSRIRRARQLLGERLAKLTTTPAQLDSTLANLDVWAARLRNHALGDGEPD